VSIWKAGGARAIGVSNYNTTHLQEIVDAGLPLPALLQSPFHLYRSSSQMELLSWCARVRAGAGVRRGWMWRGKGGLLATSRKPAQLTSSPPVPHSAIPPPTPHTHTHPHPHPPPPPPTPTPLQRGIVFLSYSPFGVPDWHAYPPPLPSSQLAHPVVTSIATRLGVTPAQVLLAWQWALGIPANPRSMSAAHMAENLAAYAPGAVPLLDTDVALLSSVPQNYCADDPKWYECAGPAPAA
jgi:diketogulonate reductase-like aldo/keto reductase